MFRLGEIENIGKSSTYRDANTHTTAQSWLPSGWCYFVNVNGTSVEVEFMELIGSAIYEDLTRLSKHHLQREASEKQMQTLESYGIIVYSEY
ncbi:hypothetical protein F8M41_016928 [Gigaspora margarita]|uniref:Uncharacterized protein n=1 Tax=Gigaspora margarita TaxID=4874 RepID=A0A8H4ANT4_GIGMA|nr:hypothetical protein F8M41_016928 [Gigaspora margarita]